MWDSRFRVLSPGERRDDDHFISWFQCRTRRTFKLRIDENFDVRTNLILLVDHAKSNAGITNIQVTHQFIESRAFGLYLS